MMLPCPTARNKLSKEPTGKRKKMLRDSQYRSDYVAFINDIIAKGYDQRVPNELLTPTPGKVWYLPHHGVYHPPTNEIS